MLRFKKFVLIEGNIIRQHNIKASWPLSAGDGALYWPLMCVFYTLPESVICSVMTVFKTNVILKSFFPEQGLELEIL